MNAFQLAAQLGAAAASIEDQVAAEAKAAAYAVRDEAAVIAPVRTGALRDSIEATGEGTTWAIGPTVPYGVFVEFGTSDTAPQPYLGPAADAVAPGFETAVLNAGANI